MATITGTATATGRVATRTRSAGDPYLAHRLRDDVDVNGDAALQRLLLPHLHQYRHEPRYMG